MLKLPVPQTPERHVLKLSRFSLHIGHCTLQKEKRVGEWRRRRGRAHTRGTNPEAARRQDQAYVSCVAHDAHTSLGEGGETVGTRTDGRLSWACPNLSLEAKYLVAIWVWNSHLLFGKYNSGGLSAK